MSSSGPQPFQGVCCWSNPFTPFPKLLTVSFFTILPLSPSCPPPPPHIEGAFYWYCWRANPPSTYTEVLFKMSVTEWTPSSFFGPCLGVCCWSNHRLWEVSVTGRHPSSGWFKQKCIRDKLKIQWIIVLSSSSFQGLWAMSSNSWKQKQNKNAQMYGGRTSSTG